MRVHVEHVTTGHVTTSNDLSALRLVHELAEVYWDRDCADVDLRVKITEAGNAVAFSGRILNEVATWSCENLAWTPTVKRTAP